MLILSGFAASNYYNKVKLALLEKDVPFEEELVWIGEVDRSASPLGKVPYLRTEAGKLCESSAINEYIEAAYPQVPLLPADPFAAAKVRELTIYLELHLEPSCATSTRRPFSAERSTTPSSSGPSGS